jgi:hypothetical protein
MIPQRQSGKDPPTLHSHGPHDVQASEPTGRLSPVQKCKSESKTSTCQAICSMLPPQDPLSSMYSEVWLPVTRSSGSAGSVYAVITLMMLLPAAFDVFFKSFIFSFHCEIGSLLDVLQAQKCVLASPDRQFPSLVLVSTLSSTKELYFKSTLDVASPKYSSCAHQVTDLQVAVNSLHTPLCRLRSPFSTSRILSLYFVGLLKFIALTHIFRWFLRYSVHDEGIM